MNVLPFKNGRSEWNNRFYIQARAQLNWQILCAVFALIAMSAEAHVAYVLHQHHVETIVVKVNGEEKETSRYVVRPETVTLPKDSIIQDQLERLIRGIRGINNDRVDKKREMDRANAMLAGEARGLVDAYFEAEPPHITMKSYVVSLSDFDVIPEAGGVWRLRWLEERLDKTNAQVMLSERWEAVLTVAFQLSESVEQRELNPFGIVIPTLTWSRVKR